MRKANKGCAAGESEGRRGHGDSREAGEEEQRWARGFPHAGKGKDILG